MIDRRLRNLQYRRLLAAAATLYSPSFLEFVTPLHPLSWSDSL
jgi:hypothetical protein